MLVVMSHSATPAHIQGVVDTIREMGYEAAPIPGRQRTAVGLVGNDGKVDASRLEALPGVLEVIHVTQPYKQVSREWREEPTIVELANGTRIGGDQVVVMAGPCSVESEEQIIGIARRLRLVQQLRALGVGSQHDLDQAFRTVRCLLGKAANAKVHAEASALFAQKVSRRLQLTAEQRKSLVLMKQL